MKKSDLTQLVIDNLPLANSINNLIEQRLKLKSGGGTTSKVKQIINEYSLDTSHFDINKLRKTTEKETIICPSCKNGFVINKFSKKKRVYCSIS